MSSDNPFAHSDAFDPGIRTVPVKGGYEVIAKYYTPAWVSFLHRLHPVAIFVTALILFAAGFVLIPNVLPASAYDWGDGFTNIVILLGGLLVAVLLSMLVNAGLMSRGYFLTPGGNARLWIELAPDAVRFKLGSKVQSINRLAPIRFFALDHRDSIHEQRDEQRRGEQIPLVYRQASQIWMEHGERKWQLAEVASQDRAAQIVQRLQAVNEYVLFG